MTRALIPGFILLLAIGLIGRLISSLVPVNHLIITIAIGLIIGNTYGIPDWARTAVGTHKIWLEMGIIVMGASIALNQVIAAGLTVFLLVVTTVAITIFVVELLARFVFSIEQETGSLLAAGSSICGVSAVVAIAESIIADDASIAYAAATILLFDATTLFVYPLVGQALELSSRTFGIWAGLTMFSTGPVTAAGFAFSKAAGQWAVLVKLTRNSLIGLVAIAYAVYYARKTDGPDSNKDEMVVNGGTTTKEAILRPKFLWSSFPKFVLGFLVVMVIANLGFLSDTQITSLSNLSDWAFLIAFAGLGLEIRFTELRSTGYKPIFVVFTSLVIVASAMLFIVQTLF